MKGIRIQVIHGNDSGDITRWVNQWLENKEDRVVVISISPAMPMGHGITGGYVTIQYTGVENLLSVPVKSPEGNE